MADLFVAWRGGDPREMESKKQALWAATESGIFGLNQLERYSRNLRESFAGKKEKFAERAPLGEVVKQLVTADVSVPRSQRKLEGGERVLHALGVRTVQDQVEQVERKRSKMAKLDRMRRRMEAKDARKNTITAMEDSLDAYGAALAVGDTATAASLYGAGQAAGTMNFSPDPTQAAREASFLKNRLKTLRRSAGFLPVR